MGDRTGDLRIRQLDDVFDDLRRHCSVERPGDGWLKTIREALGMSMAQAAERLGVSASMVAQYENAERELRTTLGTLRRVADGLDCELVYAVVPRSSLADMRRRQARRVARERVASVHDSMELEDQAISEEEKQRQVEELVDDLLREWPRSIWDEP